MSAQLTLGSNNTSTSTNSNIPSQVQNAFNAAKQRAGSNLGSQKTDIVATAKESAAQGYKQEFTNGIIIYRNGDSQAFPIYGAFANKYMAKSGTLDVGFPTSDITKTDQGDGLKQSFTLGRGGNGILIQRNGRSEAFWIHGDIFKRYIELGGAFELGYPTTDEANGYQGSVYQLYDGGGLPSLQHYNGNTFLLRAGIRDFWASNFSQLGLPQSDEQDREDGEGVYQKFEKAVVTFSSGRPQIQAYQNTTSPQVDGNFSQPNLSNKAYTTSLNPIIARNGLSFKGQCTWYVSGRLIELGKMPSRLGSSGFVGNAKAWKSYAESKGLSVSRTPSPGAVAIWIGGTYGHVAFVERVNSNGSFIITESNYISKNTFGTATITTSSRSKLGSLYFVSTPQ